MHLTDKVREMADPNLTESAWRRAKEDAAGVYPTTAFQIGGALVTLIAGAIAAVVSANESTSIQIAVPVLGGAVALGMTFLAVLIFQLAAAPVRQRNALRANWPTSAPRKSLNVEIALRNLHRKGDDLATRLEKEGYAEEDREKVDAWAEEVVALMTDNVPDDATRKFLEAGDEESGFISRLRVRVATLWVVIYELYSEE